MPYVASEVRCTNFSCSTTSGSAVVALDTVQAQSKIFEHVAISTSTIAPIWVLGVVLSPFVAVSYFLGA